MIYGIGTDILAIKRIESIYKKYSEAFPRRILSRIEALEFDNKFSAKNKQDAVRFLAKRFAAKEALAKAVGTGVVAPVSLHNISLNHTPAGKPEFICEPVLSAWLTEQGIGKLHLSLSDEARYISAFVVAETA